jgi:signal transduction histidine kinase
MPRLFEPFSQERANYARPFEGIGLGLAIARHYLTLNHAQISVQSEKGRGSTFTIDFLAKRIRRLQAVRSPARARPGR